MRRINSLKEMVRMMLTMRTRTIITGKTEIITTSVNENSV
jgi:hypothetical protein